MTRIFSQAVLYQSQKKYIDEIKHAWQNSLLKMIKIIDSLLLFETYWIKAVLYGRFCIVLPSLNDVINFIMRFMLCCVSAGVRRSG